VTVRSEYATTSEAIVQALKEAGITTIFGIPSIHNIGLYDAIRRDGSFRHIVCRHEAAATHMADGYARASGSTAVIISSTGPGQGLRSRRYKKRGAVARRS
jgi:acetolactate synthase-1/2/3 large subunit